MHELEPYNSHKMICRRTLAVPYHKLPDLDCYFQKIKLVKFGNKYLPFANNKMITELCLEMFYLVYLKPFWYSVQHVFSKFHSSVIIIYAMQNVAVQ